MNKSIMAVAFSLSAVLSLPAFGGQPETHDALCYSGIKHNNPSVTGRRCAVTVIANAFEATTNISIGGGANHKIKESDSGVSFNGHPAIYIQDGQKHCYRRTADRFKLCYETIN